jgi:uncharacterized membrane protein
MPFALLKYVHIVGAALILGMGSAIGCLVLLAHLRRNVPFIARIANVVAFANLVLTAVIFTQPLTGVLLYRASALSMSEGWVIASLVLYGVAGLLWLPTLWMQEKMTGLAQAAAAASQPLPAAYHRLFRMWSALALFGLGAVTVILWLMITKPF